MAIELSRKAATESAIARNFDTKAPVRGPAFPRRFSIFAILQNVTAQVLVFHDVRELLLDVGCVELYGFFLHFRRLEGNFLEDFFKNRMKASRTDVFGLFVDASGEAGDGGDRVIAERKFQALGIEEGDVLLDQGVLRFSEDADKIGLGKRAELDADGEAALELGNQVGRLGSVERARGDKQNVVGADHPVAGIDGGAFNDRQNIALHSLAGNVGAVAAFAPGDLVDFVDE